MFVLDVGFFRCLVDRVPVSPNPPPPVRAAVIKTGERAGWKTLLVLDTLLLTCF